MRWEDLPESQNVEDRRGEGGGGGGGGGGGFPVGAGGLSIGTILVLGLDRIRDRHRPEHADRHGRPVLAPAAAQSNRRSRAARRTGIAEGRSRADSSPASSPDRSDLEGHLRQAATAPIARRSWSSIAADSRQLRWQRHGGDGAVLLPGRQEDLSRHLVLRHDREPLQGLRRRQPVLPLRTGLCDRARGRASRAERARHPSERAAGAAAPGHATPEANRIQVRVELQADCLAGIWANRAQERLAARRYRGRAAHRQRDRRRHVAAQLAGPGGAGSLHPRLVRAAPALVLHRLQAGHGRQLQHVLADGAA